VTVNDNHHASYYPGARPLLLKLLWDPEIGRVLGAQVTGLLGVDKRLDVMATAIMGRLTIDDLAQLDLAYAPPFGSAKDIVNLAAFTACSARDGLVTPLDAIPDNPEVQVVDTRPAPLVQAHPLTQVFIGSRRGERSPETQSRRRLGPSSVGDRTLAGYRLAVRNHEATRSGSGRCHAEFTPPTPDFATKQKSGPWSNHSKRP